MTRLSAAALAAALLLADTAAAKPLYATVPRAWGTAERPVVDVAFAGAEPVELRVLKPRDLDAFVRAQSNLRRAWTQPPVRLNTGRLLGRGLNAMDNPGWLLRRAMDEELRREVAPALPKTDRPDGPRLHVSDSPAKLVGLPPGTELVRSEWLNLDLGGTERDFDVPGFEWEGSYGFQERRVSLAPLPAGVYVLQLVQGRIEGQVVLVVTDLAVQVKQTGGEVLVRVAGRDGKPRKDARVSVYAPGTAALVGTTDANGEARVAAETPRLLVTAALGGDTGVVDTDYYPSLSTGADVFLYSDRPIYRPGDEARFRGILRRPDSFLARLFSPKNRRVRVRLVAQESAAAPAAAREVSATVDEFGCFSGSLAVPEGLDTGLLRLVAEVDTREHQSEARVQQYVKPTFYGEIVGEQETVLPGGRLQARVRARRYDGGVPKDAAYEVFLYRTLVDSPAWVDDAGLGAKGSAVTYGGPSSHESRLSAPERLYSSVVARQSEADGGDDPWARAPRLDANGEAAIDIEVPALNPGDDRLPWRYSLTVRLRDDQGTFATASRGYYLAPSEVIGTLSPGAGLVMAGSTLSLAVRSTTLGGRAQGGVEGSVEFVLRRADGSETKKGAASFKTGADGVWRGAMPSDAPGTMLARVTLKDRKGGTWSGEAKAMVAGTKGEPVADVPALAVEATGGVLVPGGIGELVALLPAGWIAGEAGPVWVTLSGARVYDSRIVQARGRTLVHRFQVERRFGSAVYASVAYPNAEGRWEERTVPFRIVPAERTLAVRVRPERPEAAPLGTQTVRLQVLDSEGRGAVAQVSVGVVDKAIYALQPEFRPGVVDFFYPLTRDNVQTFQSAEFQGYGYGEALARARGRLSPYQFAAIKPPTRRPRPQEQDTAYWNPAVVTDADGHASVTFTLPSNQTEWVVTAVAADASGRFGEGTAGFASRGQVNLVASFPQFLREGDKARGLVRVSRAPAAPEDGAEAAPAALRLSLKAAAGPELGSASAGQEISLDASGEKLVALSLDAAQPGRGGVDLAVAGLAQPLSSRREVPVRAAVVVEEVEQRARGGGSLALQVPAGATVDSVELSLLPGTVEAALDGVRGLLSYPWGCLEQLVSTTVPNVAVYRALERAGALDKLDPESRALLAEARSRAEQGVQRILSLSVSGGGFTWFHGYSTPSVPLTIIALDGLSHAVEAGLVSASEPRIAESARWLAEQRDLPQALDAARVYALARLGGKERASLVRAFLGKPLDHPHSAALAVLAAQAAGVAREPAVSERVGALVAASRGGLAQLATWRPDEAYWLYPLRRTGLGAVLAHASSPQGADLDAARRRFVEALSDRSLPTFDRSTVLLHGLWLVEKDAREMRALPPPQTTIAKGSGEVRFTARGGGLAAALDPSVRELNVGAFDGAAILRARLRVPLASAKPVTEGLSLTRTYSVLRGSERRPLEGGTVVHEGEDVLVEFAVDAAGDAPERSGYWVLEDEVPAGFEPLTDDREYRGSPWSLPLTHESLRSRSVGTERVTFFFEEPAPWSRSARVIGYVMRARFAGRFQAPPADAADMYSPRIRASTAAAVLTIEPAGVATK